MATCMPSAASRCVSRRRPRPPRPSPGRSIPQHP
jgi:hypothetical protein